MTPRQTGGCLCGAVRYRVAGPLSEVSACHCSQCRRLSGHFAASTTAQRADVTIDGEVAWFESTPGLIRRGFCPVCGSNLFWERVDEPTIDIWAGTLDVPTGLKLVRHIHVASQSDYYEIKDGVPRFAGSSLDGPELSE